jgi:signal transduction histidine kinase
VKPLFGDRNRLLFRSYLFLVGGLLLVAIVLDFGFRQLQSQQESDIDRWLESTLQLIEAELARTPPVQRDAKTTELANTLGIGVQLLARDDVYVNLVADQKLTPLVDADGNTSYLHDAASIDAIVRLGPLVAPRESLLLELLPPVFYLSIFVVVGLWLRPLLRDINVISSGANRFAADYREPLSTAEQTTELTPLARNLDQMAARLSGVLRSQKELIAALSHEMRTPLARIRFALAVVDDKADAQLKEKLAAMNDDVQEIDDLVASMLNYARLDHPDIEMHWQAVPMEAWLEKIIDKAPGDTIRIEVRAADAPDKVRMDPRLMELALSNLLVNATRYADSEVRCTLMHVAGDYVLSVEDDGAGIPDAARENIFKAFTRIDDSRNRETGGYGLGLAVVARVAELHGGNAAVDASPELGGARFRLSWPAQD